MEEADEDWEWLYARTEIFVAEGVDEGDIIIETRLESMRKAMMYSMLRTEFSFKRGPML